MSQCTISNIRLATLAIEINSEHQAACDAARTAIEHARRCGHLLIEAKRELGHGAFLPWLAKNCDVKERQARNYMRVADKWHLISKSAPGADLSIKQALRLTTDSPTRKEEQRTYAVESDYGLPCPIPQDGILVADFIVDGLLSSFVELTPLPELRAWFVIGIHRDLDTDSPEVVYSTQGIAGSRVPGWLKHHGIPYGQHEWSSLPYCGELPWYYTAESKPGRVYRGGGA